MLTGLSVRDIVLIELLDLAFASGLSALTGETGAGKSILLDALALALGGRGDAALVRAGCKEGQVSAVFEPPAGHPVFDLLRANDLGAEDALILRRVQAADGRSRAFVNDQPVSARLMREIGASLVEIHGQHAERALVDPAVHRSLLDAFGGLAPQLADTAALWRRVREAEAALAAHRDRVAAARADADWLAAAAAELEALAAEPGEEERLAERRQRMMAAERIATDLAEAVEAIGGRDSPVPQLAGLLRRLERKAEGDGAILAPALDALARSLDSLEEARASLEAALAEAAFDPQVLEATEERLFALRAAARKYRVPADDLPAVAAGMAERLAALDAGAHRLAALEAEAAAARGAFETAAAALSERRAAAARDLEAAVAAELAPLKLERARFSVELSPSREPAAHGCDQVEFHVQTNPGTKPGPIMKIASGGELARFLLALKVALADKGSAPTLVFDEIDTGVGGAVADAIGVRMARLARKVQVLAVTHAPQVAARADHHFVISKAATAAGTVATAVDPVAGAARREEVARMLAGAVITDEARAAADRLLAAA